MDEVGTDSRVEMTSGILTVEQVKEELSAAPALLRSHGFERVTAFFGFGSLGDIDQLWKDHHLATSDLLAFAAEGEARGLFEPGLSDLYIKSQDGETTLQFCHDRDIHLASSNAAFVLAMEKRWKANGFSGYRKVGEEWVPL